MDSEASGTQGAVASSFTVVLSPGRCMSSLRPFGATHEEEAERRLGQVWAGRGRPESPWTTSRTVPAGVTSPARQPPPSAQHAQCRPPRTRWRTRWAPSIPVRVEARMMIGETSAGMENPALWPGESDQNRRTLPLDSRTVVQ